MKRLVIIFCITLSIAALIRALPTDHPKKENAATGGTKPEVTTTGAETHTSTSTEGDRSSVSPSTPQQALGGPALAKFRPEAGDSEDNVRYLERRAERSFSYGIEAAQEALSLLTRATGDRSRALLIKFASSASFNSLVKHEPLDQYEAVSDAIHGQMEKEFPGNLYIWDRVMEIQGITDDPATSFLQVRYIWEKRGENPYLTKSEDFMLGTLLAAGIESSGPDFSYALGELQSSGGLEARSKDFFEVVEMSLPSACMTAATTCASPLFNNFIYHAQGRLTEEELSLRLDLLSCIATLAAVAEAYRDPLALEKQREYIHRDSPNELRLQLMEIIDVHEKQYLFKQPPAVQVLLLAKSSTFENVLLRLDNDEIQTLKNSIEEAKEKVGQDITFSVLRSLKQLRNPPKIPRGGFFRFRNYISGDSK